MMIAVRTFGKKGKFRNGSDSGFFFKNRIKRCKMTGKKTRSPRIKKQMDIGKTIGGHAWERF